jgi:O-antigen ligase
MALFALGGVSIIFFWLADGWRLGTLRISRNPLQYPLLGMVLLGLFQLLPLRSADGSGTLGNAVKSLSFDPYATRLVLVQITTLLIFFAAALVFIDTPHRLRIIVRTIAIFGFVLAIFGMTQSFTSPNKVYWVRELAQSTAFGPFINRHHFAGYMELAIAVPLGLLFSGAIEGEKKLLYLFAVVMMGVALILTNSRGGIISLMAEIGFLVAIVGVRRRSHRSSDPLEKQKSVRSGIVRAILALALVLGILLATVFFGGEQALSRFVGSVNTEDPTTGRAHFWNITIDIIRAHPFIGTGLGAFAVVYTRYDTHNGLFRLEQAHNDYLQILSDGGIVGAALGLFFIVALFRMGLLRRQSGDDFRRGVATGALAGCFAVLVHSFFDFTLHTTANALLFLMLAALASLDSRVEGRTRRTRRRRRSSSQSESEAEMKPAGVTE